MPLLPSLPAIPNTHEPALGLVHSPDAAYGEWAYHNGEHWTSFNGTALVGMPLKASYKLPDHIVPAITIKLTGSFKFRDIEVELSSAQTIVHHDQALKVVSPDIYAHLPAIALNRPHGGKKHRLTFATPKPFMHRLLFTSFDDHMILASRVAACAAANAAGRKARIDDLRGLRFPSVIELDSVPLEVIP